MKREHDRFEALAGAVALGEASAEEAARFGAHAASCAACRADAEFAPSLVATFARARAGETWRPSLHATVSGRIADSRARRTRWTLGALGWGVGFSLALDLAFAAGVPGRLQTAFAPAAVPVAASAMLRTAAAAPPHAASSRAARSVAAAPSRHRRLRAWPLARAVATAASPLAPRARHGAPAVAPQVTAPPREPDVLAGLDIDDAAAGARRVAVDAPPGCDADPARVAEPQPCVARDARPSGR